MSHFSKTIKSIEKKVVSMTMLKLLALIGIVGIIITITVNYWPEISNKISQISQH
jgi:hypothetical protein